MQHSIIGKILRTIGETLHKMLALTCGIFQICLHIRRCLSPWSSKKSTNNLYKLEDTTICCIFNSTNSVSNLRDFLPARHGDSCRPRDLPYNGFVLVRMTYFYFEVFSVASQHRITYHYTFNNHYLLLLFHYYRLFLLSSQHVNITIDDYCLWHHVLLQHCGKL